MGVIWKRYKIEFEASRRLTYKRDVLVLIPPVFSTKTRIEVIYFGGNLRKHDNGVGKWDRERRQANAQCINDRVTTLGSLGSFPWGSCWETVWNTPQSPLTEAQGSWGSYPPIPRPHWLRVSTGALTPGTSGLQCTWAELTPAAREQPQQEKEGTGSYGCMWELLQVVMEQARKVRLRLQQCLQQRLTFWRPYHGTRHCSLQR